MICVYILCNIQKCQLFQCVSQYFDSQSCRTAIWPEGTASSLLWKKTSRQSQVAQNLGFSTMSVNWKGLFELARKKSERNWQPQIFCASSSYDCYYSDSWVV